MNIIKYSKYLLIFSTAVLIAGITALSLHGLKLGIDFTGGSISEIEFQKSPDLAVVRKVLEEKQLSGVLPQLSGEKGLILRTPPLDEAKHQELLSALKTSVGDLEERRFESIGPTVGKELAQNAIWQLILVAAGIIFYIAYAFRSVPRPVTPWRFGWTAVIALLHDLVVVLGVFAILGAWKGIEVDSLFVTAMLTVLGFSVHDTIVVYDRVRENLRVFANQPIEVVVNKSITQTLVMSLDTSLTVLFVLLAMLFFGGETIKPFVLALFVGIITGTYSSIFVASPILVYWQKWASKKR